MSRPTLPPGPRTPGALQLYRWMRNPTGYIQECAERWGEPFTLRMFGQPPTVYSGDPELTRAMFGKQRDRFEFGKANAFTALFGRHSVLGIEGEEHRRRRRLLDVFFRGENLRRYAPAMLEEVDHVLDRWPLGTPHPMRDVAREIAVRVIIRCVFGACGERLQSLQTLLVDYVEQLVSPKLFLLANIITGARLRDYIDEHLHDGEPTRGWRRLLPAQAVIDGKSAVYAYLRQEIERYRREGDDGSILGQLVHASYADGTPMQEGEILDDLILILIAGHETTATTIAWIVGQALHHDDVLERLEDEASQVDAVQAADANTVPYVDAVIKEAMRVHPVTTQIRRTLTAELELGGYRLPPGVDVVASPTLSHFRADQWTEPEKFRPENFLENRPSPYVYYPFGGGSRTCLGNNFALLELRIALTRVFQRLSIRRTPETTLRPEIRLTNTVPENGLPVIAEAKLEGAAALSTAA